VDYLLVYFLLPKKQREILEIFQKYFTKYFTKYFMKYFTPKSFVKFYITISEGCCQPPLRVQAEPGSPTHFVSFVVKNKAHTRSRAHTHKTKLHASL